MRTRAFIAAAWILALTGTLLGPAGAAEGKERKRSDSAEYIAPMAHATTPLGPAGIGSCNMHVGCMRFEPKSGERSIAVKVADATGGRVYAYIYQDRNGDGYSDTGPGAAICGRTRRAIAISDEFPITIFVLNNAQTVPYCGGVATRGSVLVEFSTKGPRLAPPYDRTDG